MFRTFFRSMLVMLLIGMSCAALKAADDALASVEFLPVDKFDEYLAADSLPYPWHTIGQMSEQLQVKLQPWAESPITGNRVSGKGVEIYDASATDGQGIGFGQTFTQPPAGPLMLTFEYMTTTRQGNNKDMQLACNLGRGSNATLQLNASIKQGLRVKVADGSFKKIADCKNNTWYHVSIIGNTQSADIKISVTPHTNPKKLGWRSIGKQHPYQDITLASPLGQPTDLTFTSVGPAAAEGDWNIDNVVMAGDVTAPRQRWWSFVPDMSDAIPGRKVLAYFFPVFSNGREAGDPTLGWTFWSWQNLTSDLDPRRRDAGCKIQYMPLPRVPQLDLDKFQTMALAMKEDVKLGQMLQMDGFVMDFSLKTQGGWGWFNQKGERLLDAAAQTDGKFGVIPAVYSLSSISGIHGEADKGCTPEEYATAAQLLKALKHPGAMHTPDGRVMLSMWLTERHSPQWWTKVLDNLKTQGIPTALVTEFNSLGEVKNFSPIAYAMSHWGPRSPREYNWYETARPYTKVLGYPIVAQDVRTRGASLVEADNSRTIRKLWTEAINKSADWAVINTWNDYTEQAQMPSTAIGFTLCDLNAYYTQWFKTGKEPKVVRDVLYYDYRRQHTDAPQSHGVRWTFGRENPNATNNIELIAILKQPGTLVIKIDGKEYRQKASVGLTSFMAPLPKDKRFVPYFAVQRDGKETLGGLGRYTVYDKVDFPDLLYHYGVITP